MTIITISSFDLEVSSQLILHYYKEKRTTNKILKCLLLNVTQRKLKDFMFTVS